MVRKFEFSDGSTCDARNYYGDLGLEVEWWEEDIINKAHHKLSLMYHPDKKIQRGITEEEANERMRRINAAKDVLLVHKNALKNVLSRGKGSQVVPKFKCAGCYSETSLLFKEHTNKNGTKLKYCNYFCLPDCANELSGDKECKNDYGKCWRDEIKRSKEHGVFCSQWCFDTFKKNLEEQQHWEDKWKCIKCKKTINGSYYTKEEGLICSACMGEENEDWKCFWCKGDPCEKNERGTFNTWNPWEDPSIEFCSKKCIREWRKSLGQDNEELKKEEFIANKLKKLTGWNLLTDEEKENFIEQVNNSESEQFENILRQAKNLIRENRALNTRKRESKKNNSDQNNTSEGETDSGYDSNQSHESESEEEVSNLFSLAQSQTQAEQEIQKSLKENGISEQELNQTIRQTDWKEHLKKLDTPQKVEKFVSEIKQKILQMNLSKQASQIKDKKPKNGWVLPVIILTLSLLALTSLFLIIRKRSQRRF